jgi:hypothetical protein
MYNLSLIKHLKMKKRGAGERNEKINTKNSCYCHVGTLEYTKNLPQYEIS